MSSTEYMAGKYLIKSWGNGLAYTVKDTETGMSFFVQDDAASDLQDDTDDFSAVDVLDEYMDVWGEMEEEAIL